MTTIAIVDYGLGNLFNVERALEKLGATPVITSNPAMIAAADGMILPGVGAFGEGMRNLDRHELVAPVRETARSGMPTLGVCLGMQLLMDESEEFGRWPGLGLIPGRVVRLVPTPFEHAKVPQIGWNSLEPSAGAANADWSGTLLEGIEPGSHAYFVHSYCVTTGEAADSIAETEYGGLRFASVVVRDNVMGCQFHPEKSGEVGLTLLRNWLRKVG